MVGLSPVGLLPVGVAPSATAGVTVVVQSNLTASGTGTSPSRAFDATPAEGNLITCRVVSGSTVINPPVGWTTLVSGVNATEDTAWALYGKIAGAGETTIVSASTGTSDEWAITIQEFAGPFAPLPVGIDLTEAEARQAGVSTYVCAPTGSTVQADELALSVVYSEQTIPSEVWDSGFESDGAVSSTTKSIGGAFKALPATGPVSTVHTLGNTSVAMGGTATLKRVDLGGITGDVQAETDNTTAQIDANSGSAVSGAIQITAADSIAQISAHSGDAISGVIASISDDASAQIAASSGASISAVVQGGIDNSSAQIEAHSGAPVLGDVLATTENTQAIISGNIGDSVSGDIQVVLESTAAQISAEADSSVTGDIQAATDNTAAQINAHSGEAVSGAVSSLIDDLSAQVFGHSGFSVSGQVQVTTDDTQAQIAGDVTYTAEISATTESTTAQIGAHSGEAISGAVASLLDDTGGQITAISGQASSGAIGVQLGDVSAVVFGFAGVAGPTVGAVSATTEDTIAYLHAHEGEHDYGHIFVVPAYTRVFYPGVHGH